MSTKIPSVVSTMITILLLLMFGSAAMFFLLVALNGFSEREAGPALIASLACQGLGIILSAVLAWRLPRLFIEKFDWNSVLAVVVSIPASVLMGGVISSASLFLGVLVAEMLWN